MAWYRCGGGGSGALYYNGVYHSQSQQITDVSGFTKIYNTSVAYGSNGTKVATALGLTDESTIAGNMTSWNAPTACYYDAENLSGAYAGYSFSTPIDIQKAKFWLGKYQQQNKSLYATVQWLDGNGNWNDIKDLDISTSLSYPTNYFEVDILKNCYGIRWVHKTPNKTSGNNVTFFGMTLYEGTGTSQQVYIPDTQGLNEIPTDYDGFGTIYVI